MTPTDTNPTDEQLAAWERLAETAKREVARDEFGNAVACAECEHDLAEDELADEGAPFPALCEPCMQAAARKLAEAVPALIAALRRERAALALLDGCVGSIKAGVKIRNDEMARLRAERDEARRCAWLERDRDRYMTPELEQARATMATWPKEEKPASQVARLGLDGDALRAVREWQSGGNLEEDLRQVEMLDALRDATLYDVGDLKPLLRAVNAWRAHYDHDEIDGAWDTLMAKAEWRELRDEEP